jgi:hypothetical protein
MMFCFITPNFENQEQSAEILVIDLWPTIFSHDYRQKMSLVFINISNFLNSCLHKRLLFRYE